MVKRWLSYNRRLAALLVMFLVVGSGTLIYFQFFHKNLSVAAATTYTVNVGGGVPYTVNSIKEETDEVYKAMHERMPKYLGTPKFNQIWVLNSADMKNWCMSHHWPEEFAANVDGEYDLINRITLKDTIFNGGMNNSHVVIGHEMIHGFVVRRETKSRNLVEEGMTEYLAAKYLYGQEGAYPNEVAVTGEILNTFARLGDTNKDETLQKIMFQEGFDAGLNNRLNKYLPEGQTSAFAYLNTMYNNGHYDKATAWLTSIKGETVTKSACTITATGKVDGANIQINYEVKNYTLNKDERIQLTTKAEGEDTWSPHQPYLVKSPYVEKLPTTKKTYQVAVYHVIQDENTCASDYWTYDPTTKKIEGSTKDPTGGGSPSPANSINPNWKPDLGKIRFPKTNITSIPDLLTKLVYIFLPAAGSWAVIALIWSGIMYITAAGNAERQEKAKKNMTWAITGIVIIALSGLIVYTFARILEGTQPMPGTSVSPSISPSASVAPSVSPSPSNRQTSPTPSTIRS